MTTAPTRIELLGVLDVLRRCRDVVAPLAEQITHGDMCKGCGATYWETHDGANNYGQHRPGCSALALANDVVIAIATLERDGMTAIEATP